jgi:hypothetical protein
MRQQMMNIRHASDARIFNRHHGKACASFAHGRESILKTLAGQRVPIRKNGVACQIRIGTGATLKGDYIFRHLFFLSYLLT